MIHTSGLGSWYFNHWDSEWWPTKGVMIIMPPHRSWTPLFQCVGPLHASVTTSCRVSTRQVCPSARWGTPPCFTATPVVSRVDVLTRHSLTEQILEAEKYFKHWLHSNKFSSSLILHNYDSQRSCWWEKDLRIFPKEKWEEVIVCCWNIEGEKIPWTLKNIKKKIPPFHFHKLLFQICVRKQQLSRVNLKGELNCIQLNF